MLRRDAMDRIGMAADYIADGAALAERLSTDWAIDVVVLDLALASPELLDRIVGLGLTRSGPAIIAIADVESADLAGMALASRNLIFLDPDADDKELGEAIEGALQQAEARVVADRSDRDFDGITALSREVERIASALVNLASAEKRTNGTEVGAAQIRALIKARRARDRYFPAELFSDPAWDMMLDLTAARLEGQAVSVSSLCIAAAVPTTTALRWIRSLCETGLFERRIDPGDARRALVQLSDATAQSMLAYLAVVVGEGVV
ncbi:MAG: hypothetical protein ACRCUI_00050 [Polymorphobacter sp.]